MQGMCYDARNFGERIGEEVGSMAKEGERGDHEQLARLVRRAQGGDRGAFDELYACTAQLQYFAILGKVGPDAAPDLLQELYLIAWRNLARVKPKAFVGYLNATARNLCRDYFKRQGGTKAPAPVEDAALESVAHGRGAAARSAATDPASAVADADERARLSRALREDLNDRERDVVLMRYYQNMKLDEIAQETGLSLATVKRAIASALEKLRARLGVLPVGAVLGEAVVAAVEESPAPGLDLRAAEAQEAIRPRREGAVRALGLAAMAVAAAAVAFAAFLPRQELLPEEPIPAAPAESARDAEGPVLADRYAEGDVTVLCLADPSGVAEAWCIGEDGMRLEPMGRPSSSAAEGEWRFTLHSGTWELHAVDTLGNESAGTLAADIVEDAF